MLACVGCFRDAQDTGELKVDHFIGLYDEGEEPLLDAIRLLSDSDRLVMIDLLLSHVPSISNLELCLGLTNESIQSGCEARVRRTRERPHLWGNAAPNDMGHDLSSSANGSTREAAGPSQTAVSLENVESLYSQLTAIPSSCGIDNHDCRIVEALNAVSLGDITVGGQMCIAVRSQRWRDECFFRLAEKTTALLSQRTTALRDGIEFCLMAGEFRNYCAEQVFAIASALAAPSFSSRIAWEPALEQLSALRELWAGRGESLSDDIEHRFWSVLAQRSVTVSEELCGDPLGWLPDMTASHFRSAIAYRFVGDTLAGGRLPGESREDLQFWIDGVRGALAQRCNGEGSLILEDTRGPSIPDYWPLDERGDESIPAVMYLGRSRRPCDEINPEVDEIIATLEALARFENVPDSLIMSVRNHESEILRSSVNRLYNKRIVREHGSTYEGP